MVKRGKVRPSISSDPAPSPKRAALIGAPAATAPPTAPSRDWKADPELRAFACLLSFDAGWMTEPGAIEWSYDETTKAVEVKRPEGSESSVGASRGAAGPTPITSKNAGPANPALTILDHIGQRWGAAVRTKALLFSYQLAPEVEQTPLGPRATYLRLLASRAATAGAGAAQIEIALVDLLRTCVSIVRGANLGDPSPSAATTRAVASGALLEMINPPPPSV
jgi:hypothetical protein